MHAACNLLMVVCVCTIPEIAVYNLWVHTGGCTTPDEAIQQTFLECVQMVLSFAAGTDPQHDTQDQNKREKRESKNPHHASRPYRNASDTGHTTFVKRMGS